jgi:hypothetical protein
LKRTGFPPELVARFFGGEMQPGDITAPFRGSDGRWSIFKLTSRRLQSENLTLDNPEVRKDAADTITNQRKQLVSAALLEVALREADIDNKLAESMLNSASSLSSQRPAGAATPVPAAPASSPSAAASPAANGNANPAGKSGGAGNAGAAANANR